jgi:DNA-binding transcriptional MerR regulator
MVGQVARTVKPLWYRQTLPVALDSAAEMPPAARPAAAVKAPAAEAPEAAPRSDVEARYSISDLAREFAVTTRAIRFYEDEGLLQPARAGQARIYGERERVRIKLILRGKRLGLALSEIRELFDIYAQTRSERSQLEKFLVMLADRRAMLQQQREDIDAVLAEIGILERDCRRRLKTEPAPSPRGGKPVARGV